MHSRTPRKVCSHLGMAFVAMWIVTLGATLALTLAARFYAPWFIYNELGNRLLENSALYLVGAPVFLLVLRIIPNGWESPREPMEMTGGRYVLLLVVCMGLSYAAINVVALPIGFFKLFSGGKIAPAGGDAYVQSSLVGQFLFQTLLAPMGNSFLFLYCPRRKLKGAGDKAYILFSAACFAMFCTNPIQMPVHFVLGVVLAWVYTQTGSLWYSISLYALNNLVALLLQELVLEHLAISLLYGGLMFILMAVTVAALVQALPQIRAHMRVPEEAGWVYKPQTAFPAKNTNGIHDKIKYKGYIKYCDTMDLSCPELTYAAYNNMLGNNRPPAYQNMRPVWPGDAGVPAVPFALGQGSYGAATKSESLFRTCFLNPGMLLYLLGALTTVVLYMVA